MAGRASDAGCAGTAGFSASGLDAATAGAAIAGAAVSGLVASGTGCLLAGAGDSDGFSSFTAAGTSAFSTGDSCLSSDFGMGVKSIGTAGMSLYFALRARSSFSTIPALEMPAPSCTPMALATLRSSSTVS